MAKPKVLKCSFCFKTQHEVIKLIAGPDIHICNECVDLCNEILEEEKSTENSSGQEKSFSFTLLSPKQVYDKLSQYVIGQSLAKKVISVAIYKHLKSTHDYIFDDLKDEKENILLIGPTGTGKTFIAKVLASIIDAPFGMSDATAFTEAGYVGEDVEIALVNLLHSADDNVAKAEKGIVYIDEIDKIAKKSSTNVSITRDVSGEGVQQALLNLIGGGIVRVDAKHRRKKPDETFTNVNTKKILFICGGAFTGIEEVILNRLRKTGISLPSSVGQNASVTGGIDQIRQLITPADLITFGFIPEFVARFSSIVTLSSLDEKELIEILKNPHNGIIHKYERIFQSEGVNLIFQDDAIKAIAHAALREGAGARGLKRYVDKSLLETLFEIPDREDIKTCIVDQEVIEKQKLPTLLDASRKPVVLNRNRVFISYSRKDVDWLQKLNTTLSPLLRNKVIDVWFDGLIKPSQEWRKEIEFAMASTKVAVLLVSPNFLASDFAMKEELPYFLEMAEKNKVKILWILLSSCLYNETSLGLYQAVHDISKPLSALSLSEQDKILTQICEEIKSAVNDI